MLEVDCVLDPGVRAASSEIPQYLWTLSDVWTNKHEWQGRRHAERPGGGRADSEAGSPYWHQCLTGDQALLWRSSRACAERQCAELQTAQTLQLQRPKDNFCTQTNPNFIQINEQLSFGYQWNNSLSIFQLFSFFLHICFLVLLISSTNCSSIRLIRCPTVFLQRPKTSPFQNNEQDDKFANVETLVYPFINNTTSPFNVSAQDK